MPFGRSDGAARTWGTAGSRRARGSLSTARDRLAAARSAIRHSLARELEQRRFFPWLAVAFAGGAALYFAAPDEPGWALLVGGAVLPAGLSAHGYNTGRAWRLALLLAMLFAGATAAKIRVASLSGVEIGRPFAADVEGRVVDVESRPDRRPRVVLAELAISGTAPERTPRRIRLSLTPGAALPALGARIALRARLMPVSGPAVPGAYDPHRAAFFEGIGGTGFVLGGWTEAGGAGEAARPGGTVRALRAAIVARIVAARPDAAGAVAAALLVGDRTQIPEPVVEDLRLAGLAHVLAISGLHMMLVAGTAFFVLRAGLAAVPRLALTAPIRKWAAAAALAAAFAYLMISGGSAATLRAFVMAAIMFAAILFDRPAISMRNLALALFIVVAIEPEGIVEPGLQMSFAAVAALIAAWEAWRDRPRLRLADRDAAVSWRVPRLVGRALFGTALTTLVAGLATAPIGAFHFERIAAYSLLGNMLAMPLVSLVVMPAALLVLLLMPFGIEQPALALMSLGIDGLLAVAHSVAQIEGAGLRAPHLGAAALLVMTGGFLWLTLWSERWRLIGIVPIVAGLMAAPILHDPADLMVTAQADAAAFRGADGRLRILGTRPDSFVAGQFMEKEAVLPTPDETRRGVRCDRLACIVSGTGGMRLSLVEDAAALAEDCRRADIVVTPLRAPSDCAARLVIDAAAVARAGAQRIHFAADGTFRSEGEWRGRPRRWQRAPPSSR